jgi:uncharacterized protein YwqG
VYDQIVSLVAPCIRLVTSPEAILVPGTSKFGGSPDLPKGFDWPRWQGAPLGFIGQLNLQDLASFNLDCDLPKSGLLSFFYHADQQTWGYDPADLGSWRVLFFPEARRGLESTTAPDDVPGHAVYKQCKLSQSTGISIPFPESWPIEQLGLSDQERHNYYEFLEIFIGSESSHHRILGHPIQIQGDMQLECQLASNGLYCGDSSGYADPRRVTLEAGASDWRLLLQVDSDENTKMMWGDGGSLYFWMPKYEVGRRGFDKAWMILQCY